MEKEPLTLFRMRLIRITAFHYSENPPLFMLDHFFKEIAPDCFSNNSISAGLVNNEPLRAYVMLL